MFWPITKNRTAHWVLRMGPFVQQDQMSRMSRLTLEHRQKHRLPDTNPICTCLHDVYMILLFKKIK